MNIEAYLNTHQELVNIKNSKLTELIKVIVNLNDSFCKSSVFFSMRLINYDQTVGLFIKGGDLYNYYIIGCGDLVSFPRGMILYSKENWSLAVCTTINCMIQEYYIPLQFIEELSDRQSNHCKKIYKLKRTSGKIQNCILGNNHSLFLKGRNNPINLSIWKIRVLFNDIDEVVDGEEEEDIIKLEKNHTTYEKCIDIDEFCKLNDITQLTFNLSKLKQSVTISESESTSEATSESTSESTSEATSEATSESTSEAEATGAIYNKQGVIDTHFTENIDLSRKYVVDYYISELDIYIQNILPFIQQKIKMVII